MYGGVAGVSARAGGRAEHIWLGLCIFFLHGFHIQTKFGNTWHRRTQFKVKYCLDGRLKFNTFNCCQLQSG